MKDESTLAYNGKQKPLKGPVKDENTLAYAGKQKPLRGLVEEVSDGGEDHC